MKTSSNQFWFPSASGERRPSPWWYFARAVFVSRHDYRRIFYVFAATGIIFGLIFLISDLRLFWHLALGTAFLGFGLLCFSLTGLYLQYGHYAKNYIHKLLSMGQLNNAQNVADIHIGTYRHAYLLTEALPGAKIYSVDCRREASFSAELAVREVQALEETPRQENIHVLYTENFIVPLEENSCDAVVFGFGAHEMPADQREKIFLEAKRIVKPGGRVFVFEHGIDLLNFLIFGPVIHHVTTRKEWKKLLESMFTDVRTSSLYAVNLFSAINKK